MTPNAEPVRARKRDREHTERRLVEAALSILERDGILGGLNLRDVAEHAGVGRGNIYNYFGTRRELLRQALTIRFEEMAMRIGDGPSSLVERKLRFIGGSGEYHLATNVLALLVLDGEDDIIAMPFMASSMEGLQAGVSNGEIHHTHAEDLEALQVMISAATRGYNLLRPAYARQIGVSVDELDARVRKVMTHWLVKMSEPAASGES